MTAKTIPLLAALAASTLAGCAERAASGAGAAQVTVADTAPTTPEEALPGVPLDDLTPEQRQVLADVAREEFCYCGCPHTVSQCLRTHKQCNHAPRMVRIAARFAAAGATRQEIRKVLLDYYSSFDQRAKLDAKAYGPPLGDASAPVSIVEFSDFACPYCQMLRPVLETFVTERRARAKLFYVPFPIESHPNAIEAAQAAEWARDHGLFWPMHDALFGHAHQLAVDDLASYARDLGGDPGDLRQAIAAGKYLERIRAGQMMGRAAGLKGTPTLYFDGRQYTLPDFTPAMLELTLQDEEEWSRHRGWDRD
jgi:protein-disulfide isomerase